MFVISPVQDRSEYDSITERFSLDPKEGAFIYAMKDKSSGELMGISRFDINGEYGYIYELINAENYSDVEAMFILGRATMNFIDLCGSHICRADLSRSDKKLLHAIGFREVDGKDYYECNMEGMFDGHCSGDEKKL